VVKEHLDSIKWNKDPFEWFYLENVFPEEFYWTMIRRLPFLMDYRQYNSLYPNRYLYDTSKDDFWRSVDSMFREVYGNNIRVQLCRDLPGYKIGPHTDGKREIKTILFYLAEDDTQKHLGTSVYVPKDKDFRCDGTKHHEFDKFDLLFTAEYKPNTAFGFVRSDNSFHGVEAATNERNLIQVSVWR
jgi:hypothetical protein